MAVEVKNWLCDAPDEGRQDPSLQQLCKKPYFLQSLEDELWYFMVIKKQKQHQKKKIWINHSL